MQLLGRVESQLRLVVQGLANSRLTGTWHVNGDALCAQRAVAVDARGNIEAQ